MRHRQTELARKREGSKDWLKAKDRLAKFPYRTACMRADYIHKATTAIARRYGTVFLEDLNVKGMCANHCYAKSVSDASFAMIASQFEYKARVGRIDRWYPSSQVCSSCGCRQPMPPDIRTYECPDCGAVMDRDVNAATNILHVGMANYPELMPVEGVEAVEVERSAKQESNGKHRLA